MTAITCAPGAAFQRRFANLAYDRTGLKAKPLHANPWITLSDWLMNTTHYLPTSADQAIMQSHRETYKGWTLLVEISGDSRVEDGAGKTCLYAPRIVVTEQLSIGFRELEVASSDCYATPTQCFQGGIRAARNFIDGRV